LGGGEESFCTTFTQILATPSLLQVLPSLHYFYQNPCYSKHFFKFLQRLYPLSFGPFGKREIRSFRRVRLSPFAIPIIYLHENDLS